jgi:two-component system, NarL family, nitrate/nitrite response regulator NarL
MLRVLFVHPVRAYREAVALALHAGAGFDVSTAERLARHRALPGGPPDVVLVDVAAHDAPPRVREACFHFPGLPVVALGTGQNAGEVVPVLEAGAAGYLTREDPLAALADTLAAVARGEMPASRTVAAALGRRVAELAGARRGAPALARLTAREGAILELIAEGLSNKEIARRLGVRPLTVKNHVHNLLQKLEVRRRGEAAALLRGME